MTRLERIGVVVAVAAAVTATHAQPGPGEVGVVLEPYEFEASSGEVVEAEQGTFTVPENRSQPSSRTIRLRFVRFPATTRTPGSPIIYLAGGPGGSGTGAARGSRFELFMALREVADVIAFDQRGTGGSEPDLNCEERYEAPFDRPVGKRELGTIRAAAAGRCVDRLERNGADLGGYTTAESVADLEALQRALGAERMSLLGISYGTHLGLAAMRELGERIDRVVLAGVEPLHHTYKLPSDQQALIELVANAVAADETWRRLFPDFRGTLERWILRLEESPVTVRTPDPVSAEAVEITVGGFDLRNALANRLRDPLELGSIPQYVLDLERADYAELARWAAGRRRGTVRFAMSTAMDCASGASKGWTELIESEAQTTLLGDAINLPFPEICAGAGVRDLGDEFRAPVVGDRPLLILSGTLDGRTPPRNATEVLPGLANASHVLLRGAGHGSPLLVGNRRIVETIRDFYRGTPPATNLLDVGELQLPPPRDLVDLPDDVLARHVGSYRISDDEIRRVIRVGGHLYTKRGSGGAFLIRPISENLFYYPGSDTRVEFLTGASGATTAMVMHYGDEVSDPAVKTDESGN